MRLYMPRVAGYGWPEEDISQVTTGVGSWDSPLDACCDVRHPEAVKEAINFLVSLNMEDSKGRLCMVEAAKAGDVSLLDYMHRQGASLGGEDAEGVSPYLAARAQQRAEACEWLEERGCVLRKPQTALDQAIRSEKTRVVEYLLLAGESEKFAAGEQGSWSTASLSLSLSTAKRVGNEEVVKMLEEKCRDPANIRRLLNKVKAEEASQTVSWRPQSLQLCLSTAIKVSNVKLVKSLLAKGCNPTLQDHYQAMSSDRSGSILQHLLETHSLTDDELLTLKKDLAQERSPLVAGFSPAV